MLLSFAAAPWRQVQQAEIPVVLLSGTTKGFEVTAHDTKGTSNFVQKNPLAFVVNIVILTLNFRDAVFCSFNK